MPRAACICLFFCLAVTALLSGAPQATGLPLGPLYGRNLYAPHLPWYSATAYRARNAAQGHLALRSAIYYINDFRPYPFDPDDPIYQPLQPDGRLQEADQEGLTAIDYEGMILEIGVDYQISERWRIGLDWRLHARYGGFLDGLIEGWHDLFGFPNAGRMYFDQNRAYWNIHTDEVSRIIGEGPIVALGDLDLWCVATAVQRKTWAWGVLAAFKLPLGSVDSGIGSGWPDIAVQTIFDLYPWKRWAFYLQGGFILPLETVFARRDSVSRPMLQFVPTVEFLMGKRISLLLQMNIQSSPLTGDIAYRHPLFGVTRNFALPQMDVKIGFRGRWRYGIWQFYIEEDPLTWEGPDIFLNFMMEFAVAAKKRGDSAAQCAPD